MKKPMIFNPKKQLSILFVSAYFPPDFISSTYLTTNLIDSMVSKGFKVKVITPTPSKLSKNKNNEEFSSSYMNGNNYFKIYRISLFKEPKSSFIRFIRYLLFGITVLIKSIFIKYDFIFTFSTPPSIGLFCTISSKIKKKKFIYCIQDLFPESLKNLNISESNIVYKIGTIIENFSFKNASTLITISDEIKNLILHKKILIPSIKVIENWIDFEKIHPTNKTYNPLFDKYSINSDDFNIIYSGNIGLSQNFEMIIEVAEQLKQFNSIKFLFFGDGSYKHKLIELKKSKKLDNIRIFDPESESNIKYVYGMGNLALVTSKSGVSKYSLPNKTFNIMACKIPLLISFDSDSKLWKLIKKTNSGFCIIPGDVIEMKNVLLDNYKNRTKLFVFGENGYNYVKKHLNKQVKIDKYLKLFKVV